MTTNEGPKPDFGAFGAMGARLETLRRGAAEAAEVERLTMQLAIITGPRVRVEVVGEVERRTRVFADVQAFSPASTSGSPRVRALESVLADLMSGRLA